MDFTTYIPLALRTAAALPTRMDYAKHAALGLITELGEFATAVKRVTVYGKALTDQMRADMFEEIGDLQWYVPLLLRACGRSELPAIAKNGMENVDADLGSLTIVLGALTSCVSVFLSEAFLDGEDLDEDRCAALADVASGLVWLIDNKICFAIGADPGMIRQRNIDKLRVRFPGAFSAEAAEARADKGGVDARHS